MTIIPGFSFFP